MFFLQFLGKRSLTVALTNLVPVTFAGLLIQISLSTNRSPSSGVKPFGHLCHAKDADNSLVALLFNEFS